MSQRSAQTLLFPDHPDDCRAKRSASGPNIGHAGEQFERQALRVVDHSALATEDYRLALLQIIGGPARVAGAMSVADPQISSRQNMINR